MAIKNTGELVKRMNGLTRQLSDKEVKARLLATAKKVEPKATQAARKDLGPDAAFSGWKTKRSATMPLKTASKVADDGKSVLIYRDRFSAGPWRVAEDGRNADGGVGSFQGPGVNVRTGRTSRRKDGSLPKVRRRTKTRRWNGRTRGKRTWTKATDLMAKEARKQHTKVTVEAVRKAFGGRT